jgi:nitrogen fixation NifU-like protein
MMDDLYREYILEHYKDPHNKGDMAHPDRFAAYANPFCGDRLQMGVRLDGDRVAEVLFNGTGCAISQASASMLTDEIQGKTLTELADISKEDIFAMLGITLSPARQKCALLAWEVLRKGILGLDDNASTEDDELA